MNITTLSSTELKFEKTLANLLRARFPYLYISTWEENRVMSLIVSVGNNIVDPIVQTYNALV